jgi:hypothetical protein
LVHAIISTEQNQTNLSQQFLMAILNIIIVFKMFYYSFDNSSTILFVTEKYKSPLQNILQTIHSNEFSSFRNTIPKPPLITVHQKTFKYLLFNKLLLVSD